MEKIKNDRINIKESIFEIQTKLNVLIEVVECIKKNGTNQSQDQNIKINNLNNDVQIVKDFQTTIKKILVRYVLPTAFVTLLFLFNFFLKENGIVVTEIIKNISGTGKSQDKKYDYAEKTVKEPYTLTFKDHLDFKFESENVE